MIRKGHEQVSFFTGTEVEHTPAYGLKTLFVVGVQTEDDIAANLQGCEHIYFGANMSFPNYDTNDRGWSDWTNMILPFLRKDYVCTLDIDVRCTEGLLESGLTEYHNFIPMLSVKLPYIDQLGYNATLKLDDKDFRATNPGVWCHSIHSLKFRPVFTDWSKYTKDSVL
jgi:hypothetical protein